VVQVRLENVTKKYGDVVALKQVNLEIRDRELVAIVGPSGSGKSTLLKIIAGLEPLDEGKIYIGDAVVNDLEPAERDIALVFQSYALYPHMNVYENLAFPLRIRKASTQDIRRKVNEVSELLRIQGLLQRKPYELSGGEQQRVAIGRAIVRNPNVYLMDEPLSNLDAKLRVEMRAELLNLQKMLEVTTIYVTHDQAEAMALGDRIAVIHRGEIQQFDTPMVVYNNPVTRFVAGFVGSPTMNFFEGNLLEKDRQLFLDAGEFLCPFPKSTDTILRKRTLGSKLVLGVRPEDMIICPVDKATMKVKVGATQYLGSETIVSATLGSQAVVLRSDASTCASLRFGDEIGIVFDERAVHLFDVETGQAII